MTKPSFFFVGILAVFFASTSVVAQEFTTFVTSDGHEFAVRLQADKSTIMLGETTFLAFEIKNLSDKPLRFVDGGDYRNRLGRPESFSVTVTHEDGSSVPQPEIEFSMGGLIGYRTVPINGNYVRKLFLPNWATFSTPGSYDITVERSLSISADDKTTNVFDSKKSVPAVRAKGRTKITIVKTDHTLLGSVIDSLGNSMLDEVNRKNARDSLLLLNFIQDDRTLTYWLRALDIYSRATDSETLSVFSQTPSIVAKFDTNETMLALEEAAKSKNENVRLDVADALRISKDPRALQKLLRMQNDTYWFVRLRVVQMLGQMKTDDSTERLLAMLGDEKDSVWKAAEEYLKARDKLPENLPLRPLATLNCPIRQTNGVRSMQDNPSMASRASGESSIFTMRKCDKALNAFLEELTIARRSTDTFREAWVLRQIGDIYNETKRYEDARKFYQMALPLFEQLENDAQRTLLSELGSISEVLKDHKGALGFLDRELILVRSNKNERIRTDETRILGRIATLYLRLGDDLNGFRYLNDVLELERKRKDLYGERRALIALGRAYETRGRIAEAVESYKTALEIDLGDVDSWFGNSIKKENQEINEAIARLNR